jgi:hypothetical protein
LPLFFLLFFQHYRHETDMPEAVATCPLLGEERKSLPTFKMTAFDPWTHLGHGHSRTSAHNCAIGHSVFPEPGGAS